MSRFLQVLIIVILVSCSMVDGNKTMTPRDYVQWFRENAADYSHEKNLGGYAFNLNFVPKDAFILSEFGDLQQIDSKYYAQRDSSLSGLIPCKFSIVPEDKSATFLEYKTSSPEEYGARLNYFLNEAQKDMYLLQGKDTLRCRMYHFENTYGLQKQNTIALLFDEPKKDKGDIEFVFADRALNVGTVIFTQKIKKLNSTPKLKLN